MSPAHRYCQYRECGTCIDEMRPNAKYCDRRHKALENRARDADPSGTTYPVGKPYKNETRDLRRANRRRRGTSVYVTPEDLNGIRPIRGSRRYTVPSSVGLKLQRAQKRLGARSA